MKRIVGVLAAGFGWNALVAWTECWGTLPFDVDRPMPGDALIAHPAMNATRAIVVDAVPDDVYPWFAQMGPGRAGWYSYDRIDNAGVESAREINADWVVSEPGASMGSMAGIEFVATDFAPGRHLVIALAGSSIMSFTLAYLFEPWGEHSTRVLVRVRGASDRGGCRDPLIRYVLGPADFVMVRRQLIGVKERAEHRSGAPVSR